jgi:hypothetical protein
LALTAQTSEEDKLKVYIDCEDCDITFIKQEMTNVSYVRDRLLSEVHILVVSQSTGSGGDEFTFMFYGQQDMSGYNDTLMIATDANNTADEIRRKQLKAIKIGLASYLMKKGYFDDIDMTLATHEEEAVEEEDPWKKWVFNVSAGAWFNGEEQYSNLSTNGSIDIDKVTEDWKIQASIGFYRNQSKFLVGDEWVRSEALNKWIDVDVVKSINDHWSWGVYTGGWSSLYDNYKFQLDVKPGIEYNLFPYDESSKRQMRIVYRIGPRYNSYNDSTIYQVDEELLGHQSLGVAFSMNQKWGTIESSITGSNYFHDFDLNRLNFWTSLNLRLVKGLSLDLSGSFAIIHDQINLPLGNLSDEDILLRQRQLQTGYRYWGSVGITYTFGSIYNSVVNPRFGT